MKMTLEENKKEGFFVKYKKWIVALISLQLIPTIVVLGTFFSIAIYLFINNDSNWHPYKSYIQSGYSEGMADSNKDRGILDTEIKYITETPWNKYRDETNLLKKQVMIEKDEYLSSFPEAERGVKRAEMTVENIKLPLEQKLHKRFTEALDFYADYVKKQVDRSKYASEKEYQQALREEAWKRGYEYGYAKGWLTDKVFLRKM
jgi:hypothetical protein